MFDYKDPKTVLPALREIHETLDKMVWERIKEMSVDRLLKLNCIKRRFKDMILLLEYDLER